MCVESLTQGCMIEVNPTKGLTDQHLTHTPGGTLMHTPGGTLTHTPLSMYEYYCMQND